MVRKYFFTGLAILLPLALTVLIVAFLVNLLTQPFTGMVEGMLSSILDPKGRYGFLSYFQVQRIISQILILLVLFGFTLFLGFVTRWFFFKYLITLGDYIIHRIPLISSIYKTCQDVIRTLFASQTQSFKQVVLVPFPEEGVFCLGLVTRDAPAVACDLKQRRLISVFVPTTPNPTSGYLLMFDEKDVTLLDMRVEDAIKFIISCGVIHPEPSPDAPSFDEIFRRQKGLSDEADESET